LPVKIYIDDIEKIISLFDENKIKYTLQTDQYKYESLSELLDSKKEKSIGSLKIQTFEPYISIEFEKKWAIIYVSSDETFITGLFHKIDRIINQSKRIISFSYSYYFVWVLNFLLLTIALINRGGKLYPQYIGISFSIISLFWISRIFYIRYVRYSSIQLIRKEHVSNFFQRKRDDLILSLLSALIGAILGIVGTILISKYLH
jgi:hypothetical protein